MRTPPLPVVSALTFLLCSCAPPQVEKPALAPLDAPRFDYTPVPPCDAPGAMKLTFAVVSPRMVSADQATSVATTNARVGTAGQPPIVRQIPAAMQADFFELLTCRGYLTKGPFQSFEAMVYPDREASNLLLEPELQISVVVQGITIQTKTLFGQPVTATAGQTGLASGHVIVGGRVNLTIKEPLTNTRMWTRSIDVPAMNAAFTSEKEYLARPVNANNVRVSVGSDEGLRRELQPILESMYNNVLKTAESYLNKQELATVAQQAADLRKKAAINVPHE